MLAVIGGVGPDVGTIERTGYTIRYSWVGREDGPVLVLSHSLGADRSMWEPQVRVLGKTFRILLYDHPGHGASSLRPTAGSITDYGEDVLALTEAKGLGRFRFCGLSLGGMVGLWLGAHAGDRIERLVVCNTTARIENTRLLTKRIALIRREGLEAIADSVLGKWFTPAFSRDNPAIVAEARNMLLRTEAEGYACTAETVCALDLRTDLARITVPALVVYGTFDEATPPSWNRAIAEGVRNARALELPAAHLSNLEATREFNAGVLDFLKDRLQD